MMRRMSSLQVVGVQLDARVNLRMSSEPPITRSVKTMLGTTVALVMLDHEPATVGSLALRRRK